MKIHELKIKEKYYKDVALGYKTFELRKNDRDYQEGDLIKFTVVDKIPYSELKDNQMVAEPYYPAAEDALFRITYVLKDVPEYGLDKDYCILGIKQVELVDIKP